MPNIVPFFSKKKKKKHNGTRCHVCCHFLSHNITARIKHLKTSPRPRMNATWNNPNMPCYMSHNEIQSYMRKMGWIDLKEDMPTLNIVLGPVLWTVSIIGMVLNVIIILPDLFFSFTTSSVLTISIGLILLMRSICTLLLHDITNGNWIYNGAHLWKCNNTKNFKIENERGPRKPSLTVYY